jgi:hypothetical protein
MVISEVCAVSEVLCSVSDGHLLNPAIVQFLMKNKGDALSVLRVSLLSKQRCASRMILNRDACFGGASPSYLICKKEYLIDYSSRDGPCASTWGTRWNTYVHVCVPMALCGPSARSTMWSTSCLISLKLLDCRGFKSW